MSRSLCLANRKEVSRGEYNVRVTELAYRLYKRRESTCAELDWLLAEAQLNSEKRWREDDNGVDVRDIRERAQRIYDEAEPGRKQNDWLSAVEYFDRLYVIVE